MENTKKSHLSEATIHEHNGIVQICKKDSSMSVNVCLHRSTPSPLMASSFHISGAVLRSEWLHTHFASHGMVTFRNSLHVNGP